MKLRKLSAYGIAAIAAASFAMVSTTVLATTHKTKSVKCYGANTCKDKANCKNKPVISVSNKAACEKLGGTTTKPKTSTAPAAPAAPAAPGTSTAPGTSNAPANQPSVPKTSDAGPGAPQANAADQSAAAQAAAPEQTAAVTTSDNQNQ